MVSLKIRATVLPLELGKRSPALGPGFKRGLSLRLSEQLYPSPLGGWSAALMGCVPTSPSRIQTVSPRLEISCPNCSAHFQGPGGSLSLFIVPSSWWKTLPWALVGGQGAAAGGGVSREQGMAEGPGMPTCFCRELHRVWAFWMETWPFRWISEIFTS